MPLSLMRTSGPFGDNCNTFEMTQVLNGAATVQGQASFSRNQLTSALTRRYIVIEGKTRNVRKYVWLLGNWCVGLRERRLA